MDHTTSHVGSKTHRTTIVIVTLVMVIINFMSTESVPVKENTCVTEECARAALEISAKMDTNVEPCDNFYQFVCGNYVKDDSTMPPQKKLFNRIRSDAVDKLKSVLAEDRHDTDPKPFQHVSKLYRLCMDQNTRIVEGVKPLRTILNKLGGWPLLDGNTWNDVGKDWIEINSDLIKMGYDLKLFMRLAVISAPNSNRRHLVVNSPLIAHSLPTDLIEKAVKLGARQEYAEHEISELYQFEKNFINIIKTTNQGSFEMLNLGELVTRWPTINWENFFNSILIDASAAPINANEKIHVNTLFVNKFVTFIANNNSSKLLTNYALSRVVGQSWIYIRDNNVIYPSTNQTKLCLGILYKHTPVSLDAMFAWKYVDSNERNEVVNIMAAIKKRIIEDIYQTGFDKESEKKAIERVTSLHSMIGYPDQWKSDKWLGELHGDLKFKSENFLGCILDIARFKNRYQNRIGRHHIEDQTNLLVRDKMPSYFRSENKLTVSAINIQEPLFDSRLPKYMNYGGIGFVIGHEIAHSLEAYDDVYTDIMMQKLAEKKKCFIHQYNKFILAKTRKSVNGTATANENIADNIGVATAYLAYRDMMSGGPPELALPNLQYTPKQMFWISWASKWCTRIDSEPVNRKMLAERSLYSPVEFRIIGAASNSVHFSEDFGCSAKSRMNPVEKCKILHEPA